MIGSIVTLLSVGGVGTALGWFLRDYVLGRARDRANLEHQEELRREREDVPYRMRIRAALEQHLIRLTTQNYQGGLSLTIEQWRASQINLADLIQSNDGARVLGNDLYLRAVRDLTQETLSIESCEAMFANGLVVPEQLAIPLWVYYAVETALGPLLAAMGDEEGGSRFRVNAKINATVDGEEPPFIMKEGFTGELEGHA